MISIYSLDAYKSQLWEYENKRICGMEKSNEKRLEFT